jgi:hypothetical protein
MHTSDTLFQRALSKLLVEIFDGPPGNEAFVLKPRVKTRPRHPGRLMTPCRRQ